MHVRFQIPAHDEAPTLARVVRDCLAAGARCLGPGHELSVLVLDDGSTDATASICTELASADARVTFVRNPYRRGLGVIFREGLAHARRSAVDVMVHVDGDGQFPLEHLEGLVRPILEGRRDVVMASRFLAAELTPPMRWGNRVGNIAVAGLVSLLSQRRFADVSCGFRAYAKRAIHALELRGDFTYTHEVILVSQHLGLRLEEVAVPIRGEREHGVSKVAASRLVYGLRAGALIGETFWRLARERQRAPAWAPSALQRSNQEADGAGR